MGDAGIVEVLAFGDDAHAELLDRGGANKADLEPLGKPATVNVMRFSNDQVSELLDKIARSNDKAAIIEMSHEVQRIYVDQQPYASTTNRGAASS